MAQQGGLGSENITGVIQPHIIYKQHQTASSNSQGMTMTLVQVRNIPELIT